MKIFISVLLAAVAFVLIFFFPQLFIIPLGICFLVGFFLMLVFMFYNILDNKWR